MELCFHSKYSWPFVHNFNVFTECWDTFILYNWIDAPIQIRTNNMFIGSGGLFHPVRTIAKYVPILPWPRKTASKYSKNEWLNPKPKELKSQCEPLEGTKST